jgi:hypothetical protein
MVNYPSSVRYPPILPLKRVFILRIILGAIVDG